jgi:DNA-binding transcriptional MerR regulator
VGVGGIDQSVLVRIEAEYARGIPSASILDVLASLGVKFSEATLRKWVQLGLLPRSVRVGRKGKHAGSQGMYPATIVRQILQIKEMLADGLTIEQVQTDVLFVRGDLDELQRSLSKVFSTLESAIDKVDSQPLRYSVVQDLSHARELAGNLVDKLSEVESRLIHKVELGVKAATG